MAKVIKKKSDLVEKRNRTVAVNRIGHVLLVLCGVLFIELAFEYAAGIVLAVMGTASLAGLLMVHFTRDSMGIERAGVEGEAKALKILEKGLPDTFSCINNAVIWYENRHNELDLIVVGPTGVYIVEVKNTAGDLYGSYSSKMLQQQKKNETKEMYNPIQQVRTHVDILARFLKASGIRTWVQGVVLFVNPKCTPHITDIPSNGIQVFAVSEDGEQELLDYLRNGAPNALTQQEIEKITGLI